MSTTVQVPESTPAKHQRHRWLPRVLAFLYGLVMFEVVIMVSPFAFYFYAAYGPTLKWLNSSVATAWLTGFLLPHAVSTDSWFLEFLRWDVGRYAFGLGFLSFLVLAAQIYGSKLFGRKMVNAGVYRYIRHPQYLSLGISAFGLFIAWPRVIIFFLFIGMLFAYYFLARLEERQMLAADPSYADYMRRTGMFLPGNPGGRLGRFLFGSLRDQGLARSFALASLALTLLVAGFALRAYAMAHIAHTEVASNIEVLAAYPMSSSAMQRLASAVLSDAGVQQAIGRERPATFVVHVLPRDYGMIGMFADVGSQPMQPGNIRLSGFKYLCRWLLPFLRPHARSASMGSDKQQYRLVFSRVDGPNRQPVSANQLFDLTAKMTPVYVADVNAKTFQVTRTIDPPRRSFWGDVKMPIF